MASTRAHACPASGHGPPVFTSALLSQRRCRDHAGPLRHVTGFPGPGLLRVLRPTPAASADDGPSPTETAGCSPGQGQPGWFPRSLSIRSTGPAPSYAPAASPRLRRRPSPRPSGPATSPSPEVPRRHQRRAVRAATQPRSARFELVALLRGFQPLVPHVRLSVSLAEPGPSGSTDPPRRCRGVLPPSPASPGSGCPQLLPDRCDGPAVKVSHPHSVRERLVALDVGDP